MHMYFKIDKHDRTLELLKAHLGKMNAFNNAFVQVRGWTTIFLTWRDTQAFARGANHNFGIEGGIKVLVGTVDDIE